MAVAIVLCLNVMVALADSHHEGKVYDANGWNQVAVGWWGTFDWAIDPNFPTTNDQGYNIRENMRDAMDEWAILRFGYQDYGYAEEVADFSSADYQYEECEGASVCYGSNVKQHHDDDNLCDDHWGLDGHGPICYAFSRLDPSWTAPNGEVSFGGAIAHEMGHALGLQHPASDSCNTMMGGCWAYIDTPGPLDEDSLDKIYGVPHDLSIELVSGTTIKGSSLDYSSYDQHYQFDLMKYDFEGGVWEYIGYRNAYASGGVVSYTEDVSDEGCGRYLYSVSAYNEYPDGLQAYQFGGYTDYIYVC